MDDKCFKWGPNGLNCKKVRGTDRCVNVGD